MTAVEWDASADLVVVGGGVAGLTAARIARERGARVLIAAKSSDASTWHAQGGLACLGAPEDSVQSHVADTLAAGAGLCDVDAVTAIVEGGPHAFEQLIALGAAFDRGDDGEFDRTREGGHSVRRIVHAGGDATGAEIERTLLRAPGIDVREGVTALQILKGPYGGVRGVLLAGPRGLGIVRAPSVLLATGGLGQLYQCSTNPVSATGDGIALALDAGAILKDVEFVQFHPTALWADSAPGPKPLVSEAVRGEGARLIDSRGRSVTAGVHPLGDLAPRDVVARAVTAAMRETGQDHVYLDGTGIDGFARRFPTVTAGCLAFGIDPQREPIPVAPAAHYACGGVAVDLNGRTSVPGLYAAGEVSRTGLHGANRLASNSLLEGLVIGEAVGADVPIGAQGGPAEFEGFATRRSLPRESLQALMTTHAAVLRDAAGLREALAGIESAPEILVDSPQALEDCAVTATAEAVVRAALARTESRGCHTRVDFPDRDDYALPAPIAVRRDGEALRVELP